MTQLKTTQKACFVMTNCTALNISYTASTWGTYSQQIYLISHHAFQEEYVNEGLDWDHVDYADNSTCLNLMVGKPTGLILLLDEECRFVLVQSLQGFFIKLSGH